MRHRHLILVALLLDALLLGCGDDDSHTAAPAEPASSPTSASASSAATIPDGTYAKSVTVADAKAVGITDEEFLSNNFGADGKTTLSYKFGADRWTEFVTPGGGAPEPGDGGPLTYDEQGHAVLTSESDGCGACIYVYDWQFDGNAVTLTIVGHESSDGPEDLALVRFVTAGVFTRQA
jgi:hypothetical protein